MGLLRLLALCTLAACCVARSPPAPPLPPGPFSPLHPLGCNDSQVLAVAGFALQNINRDQKDGYMLSLNRVHDVREHYQAISKRETHRMCPDCPSPIDVSSPSVLEAATESLAKFNSKSPSKQYVLFKVTKARTQWVGGPSYYVEYLIKEAPCTQSQASCSLQSSDSEPVGLCQGSLLQGPPRQVPLIQPLEKSVTVTCEFFESQAQVPGDENPAVTQSPKKLPQKNTAPTSSPSITAPRGSIQHLPDLDAEKPEESKGESPEETFPVQLDLTTNPQGDTLDVSFLYLEPGEKKLVVLPFPGKELRSAECPGPAKEKNPLILPP
ncbi:fetuin-B isoform X4 [Mastomys coucha]|nr:fetuin-B isoform X4 [Mastomys coucha]